jgi:hypothetical protein
MKGTAPPTPYAALVTFKKATAQDADADSRPQGTQTQHKTGRDVNDCCCECVLHDFPLDNG